MNIQTMIHIFLNLFFIVDFITSEYCNFNDSNICLHLYNKHIYKFKNLKIMIELNGVSFCSSFDELTIEDLLEPLNKLVLADNKLVIAIIGKTKVAELYSKNPKIPQIAVSCKDSRTNIKSLYPANKKIITNKAFLELGVNYNTPKNKHAIFNIQKNAVDAKAKNQDSFFKDIIIVEYKIVEPQTVLGFDSDDIFVSKHEAVSISDNISSTGDYKQSIAK